MLNLFESLRQQQAYSREFRCGNSMITAYSCPMESKVSGKRLTDSWAKHNYIFYVVDGKKVWHTSQGSYELTKGSCVFVRKGACIIEQFFDIGFCLVLFFVPDEFICETLRAKTAPLHHPGARYEPLIVLESSETLGGFFLSMASYFLGTREPDQSLLELKFRELILTIADNPGNAQMLSYFCSLLNEPRSVSLQRVMEENYCFNLKLEEYASIANRSLSAFKRDFQKQFGTTPGKWLVEKRLMFAKHLLENMHKTVSEAAFESGFESPSHFSRAFKERFAVSPRSARRAEGALAPTV